MKKFLKLVLLAVFLYGWYEHLLPFAYHLNDGKEFSASHKQASHLGVWILGFIPPIGLLLKKITSW